MQVNRAEIFRYLGIKGGEPDERTRDLAEQAIAELEGVVTPRFFWREWPFKRIDEEWSDFTCFTVKSRNLAKNLAGCGKVILFAATLGEGADYLIRRYSRVEVSRSVAVQAASAAMIEAFCREKNGELKELFRKDGWYLRPRFSPGYGDFSLEYQKLFCEVLQAEKTVGITLTDSLLMVPSKSVTAVIGAAREKRECEPEGCEACPDTGCPFRRG